MLCFEAYVLCTEREKGEEKSETERMRNEEGHEGRGEYSNMDASQSSSFIHRMIFRSPIAMEHFVPEKIMET